jgi:hypothetical protein
MPPPMRPMPSGCSRIRCWWEAFESVRAAATQAWQQTAIADVQARETAWLTVKIINRIETELQSIIDNGAIAEQAPVR